MLNLIYLFIAIVLETCGDASIRIGTRGGKPWSFVAGAFLVICYGTIVNFPNWSFSRTMGVYIALFFVISQAIASLMLNETIKLPTIVGGILIVAGGLIILAWRPT